MNKPEPIYCKHCGAKLIPNDIITEFNDQTGEPVKPFTGQRICPNRACNHGMIKRENYQEILDNVPGLEKFAQSGRLDRRFWP